MNRDLIALIKAYSQCDVPYSGREFEGGYHTLFTPSGVVPGQRDCIKRVSSLGFDFRGKSVLDLGCNQGGMLFAVHAEAKHCYGVDANPGFINVCHKQREMFRADNTSFFTFDLQTEPLERLLLLANEPIDVCLFMAMCNWISNWRDVIRFCASCAPVMVLETNGPEHAQSDQIEFVHSEFRECHLITVASYDDRFEKNRKCLICSNPTEARTTPSAPRRDDVN